VPCGRVCLLQIEGDQHKGVTLAQADQPVFNANGVTLQVRLGYNVCGEVTADLCESRNRKQHSGLLLVTLPPATAGVG
jgi:hypothetical protein